MTLWNQIKKSWNLNNYTTNPAKKAIFIISNQNPIQAHLRKHNESGELGRDLPYEAGVGGEPLDVALVAAVEEYRAVSGPIVSGSDEVPLGEVGELGEAEVVEGLGVATGLVSDKFLRRREASGLGSGESAEKFRGFDGGGGWEEREKGEDEEKRLHFLGFLLLAAARA